MTDYNEEKCVEMKQTTPLPAVTVEAMAYVPYQQFSASTFSVAGDALTDLHEDLAAEQKARTTYDNILRFCDDRDVRDPIRFLREREIVHYQRFGEALRIATDNLDSKNFFAFNPEFDRKRMQ